MFKFPWHHSYWKVIRSGITVDLEQQNHLSGFKKVLFQLCSGYLEKSLAKTFALSSKIQLKHFMYGWSILTRIIFTIFILYVYIYVYYMYHTVYLYLLYLHFSILLLEIKGSWRWWYQNLSFTRQIRNLMKYFLFVYITLLYVV